MANMTAMKIDIDWLKINTKETSGRGTYFALIKTMTPAAS